MTDKKRVLVRTYGCQMNVYDSERMTDVLGGHGYEPTDDLHDADLVILNTCHIREKASEKVYSEIGRLRELKAERRAGGKNLVIGVAGCVAQAEGREIMRRAPVVDMVFGPQSFHRLPELVDGVAEGRRMIETEFEIDEKFAALGKLARVGRAQTPTAFLTVQEGCDKFCTFCVVPYTRGAEVSRPVSQVVGDAERLAEAGVREITLLGQNVNAYHGDGPGGDSWSLGRLVRRLADVPGLDRIRYTTSHPRDMDDDLIAAHRELPSLMPYLHLPVQSGSDRILAAMNRRHTRAEYLRLIEKIRVARPDMALSGDFIVGFPGETEDDFQATLRIVEEADYASAFTFKYSPRPGTPAAGEPEQVDEAVKTDRLIRLQDLVNARTRAFNDSRIGMETDILIEKAGRRPAQLVGRSPWLQPVHVDAPAALIGQIVRVRIDGTHSFSLFATLLDRPDERPRDLAAMGARA